MFFIGNSFPMSLIRRQVTIKPISLKELRQKLRQEPWISYWGHANTLAIVNAMIGENLAPLIDRPALTVNDQGFPQLWGQSCNKCIVVTPIYPNGMRPVLGQEVQPADITGYQILHIQW